MTEEYKSAKAAFWQAFVCAVYRGENEGFSEDELRKAKAIQQARTEMGMSRAEIISAGQREILSRTARHRKKHTEPQRMLRWKVSRSLAEAIQWSDKSSPDAEEALQTRLVRVCGLKTSDDLFEFLLSLFADLDDKELRNLAGIIPEKKKRAKD